MNTETVEAERKNKKCKCRKYYCTLLRKIHYESVAGEGDLSCRIVGIFRENTSMQFGSSISL